MSLISVLKKLILEEVGNCQSCQGQRPRLDEIDFSDKFSDVQKDCIVHDELVEHLNKVLANAPLSTAKRTKFSKKTPFIHSKSSFFDKDPNQRKGKQQRWNPEQAEVNVDRFIESITAKPSRLIGLNEKMKKSGGENVFVYKTGVPAFRGIAYDKKTNEFYVINTCPGAGECAIVCYALKGRYIQYAVSYDNMTRALNLLLNEPDEKTHGTDSYEYMLYDEIKKVCDIKKAFGSNDNIISIRWNDSGDFFGKEYVRIANDVIKRLQSEGYNVEDYVYTKMADVASNPEFGETQFSTGGSAKELKKVDKTKQKMADYLFPYSRDKKGNKIPGFDFDYKTSEGMMQLKKKVAWDNKEMNNGRPIPIENVITLDELQRIPISDGRKYFVIVKPGQSDISGRRKDVKRILNIIH
jgi:hypothetical protein